MSQVLYPIEGIYDNKPVDVSIIIPLYKSSDVVREQILRWSKEKLKVEIIYVDDCCPEKSAATVFQSWNKRPDKKDFLVKIVLSKANHGFGRACNLGAYHAKGKYLIFLNSDTTTTPNWIEPMIEHLKDDSVGIVGNLQIKEGGDLHGTIDGAGSVWSWKYTNFVHLGRHMENGELIEKPYHLNNAPKELITTGEREMVTGCCFSIRKDLFDEVGGFDCRYRVGYWEDSELCMSVRSLGYKIIYEPMSIIFHKLSHSESGGHNFHHFNKDLFHNKWIDSQRLDDLVSEKRNLKPTKVTNVLVRRLDANGDVLVSAAVLPALKKRHPDAKFYFKTKCPNVLEDNPHIEGVLSPEEKISHQVFYDLDLSYERRPFTNILEAYANEVGVSIDDCELFLKQKTIDLPSEKYVVMHAGVTAWAGRNWHEDRFANIAKMIKDEGYDVVSIGSLGDHKMPESIDMRGKTTIPELAYLMANAKAFIGIDSFPMHVAQAVNVPGVVFFGSINPETRIIRENMKAVTADPMFVTCLGCHHEKFAPATTTTECKMKTLQCETGVSVEKMWKEISKCLKT